MKKISVTQRKSGELESDTVRTETARDSADLLHQSVLTSLYFDGRKDKTCSDHNLEGLTVSAQIRAATGSRIFRVKQAERFTC